MDATAAGRSPSDWVYAVTRRNRLYAAIGGRRGLRRLTVTAPDGRAVWRPTEIVAGPEHLFVSGGDTVAAARDGRALWPAATLPYDRSAVLLRLHRADAEPVVAFFDIQAMWVRGCRYGRPGRVGRRLAV
ncbi:hypothetical protein ACWDG1_23170 [Streptomyces sp. NPDC001177]